MEFGQIEAFERVAREGSFTRAAEALGLTQPAISTRITTLEAELGGALFTRHGRHLELTPMGVRFLPYARRMIAVMADSLQELQNFKKGQGGIVKIAAPTPFVLSFLVYGLADFREQHPTADILIRERNKTAIFDLLRDNVVALGLVNAPVSDREFAHLAHFQDPVRAVVAPEHPLAQLTTIHLRDLYQHTIFRVSMFPHMTAFMDEVAEQARPASGGAVIAIPMVMALRLVTLGQGVTFLPASYARQAVEANQAVYLDIEDMPHLMSEPVLIAHRDRQLDDIHLEFIRILKARWRHLLVT